MHAQAKSVSLKPPLRCCIHHLPSVVARMAYVRPKGELATEYHTQDFSWGEWAEEARPLVQQQQALGAAAHCGNIHNISQASNHHQQPKDSNIVLEPPVDIQPSAEIATVNGAGSKSQQEVDPQAYEGGKWDEFYRIHAKSIKFYRERRYLLLEFPVLAQQGPLHVVELGCGAGASLLPVLRHNPQARVTATDIAPTCIQQLHQVAAYEGISDHHQRIHSFVADSASPEAQPLFQGIHADVALIMFTLSAVPPAGQAAMMKNAYTALRPGGVLCIRDHGLYDMVQLRIPPEQWIGANMYKRGDGTLATFFAVEELAELAVQAGFVLPEPCQYVTVYNKNRKTGQMLRRVFVHGVFQKPLQG